jgi:hypothetical protein
MTKKKQDLTDLFIRDAGLGFENLRRAAHRDIIFYAERNIKTFKDLKKFIEDNNIPPKTVAVLIAKHVEPHGNWMHYQILNNPKQLKWIKAIVRRGKQIGSKRLLASDWLEDFADATGYEIPDNLKTFQNNMSTFARAIGEQRKHSKKAQAIYNANAARKKLRKHKIGGGKHGR